MNQTAARIPEALKFVVVGAVNTALDLLVLNALLLVTGDNPSALTFSVCKAVSFAASVINSYLMNKHWTFAGAGSKRVHVEFGQFIGVSLVGLAINNLFATLVFQHASIAAQFSAFRPTIAALVGSAAGLIWNYVGYKAFVFKGGARPQ